MKHLFVSYELAKELKQKGFDEPCMCYFNDDKELNQKQGNIFNGILNQDCHGKNMLAPTHQQVVDWLRNRSIHLIEEIHREQNPAYWVFKIGFEKQGPFLINKAIEEALKLI